MLPARDANAGRIELDNLAEMEVAINGKGYVFRGQTTGVAGKVFQACGVVPGEVEADGRQPAGRQLAGEAHVDAVRPHPVHHARVEEQKADAGLALVRQGDGADQAVVRAEGATR